MPDHKEVLDRLDRYAKACARNILRKFDLGHDWHRAEDIAQVLFLAGWQVWKAKGDEGLAKHRISSRAKNQAERLRAELKNEPQRRAWLPRRTAPLHRLTTRKETTAMVAKRKTIAAVGCARRSTDMQERSIPDQQAFVERWAGEHGYRILREPLADT